MTEDTTLRAASFDVIYLAGCAVREEVPDAGRVSEMDLSALYTVSRRHMITAAVASALMSGGIRDDAFIQAEARAQRKTALMDADRKAVCGRLQECGIWYVPLKGAVIKDLYPRYGMREMSDNDILIDPSRQADVRDIMESLGFTTVKYARTNHDVYHKTPVSNFEMHTALFGSGHAEAIRNYYSDVDNRLLPAEGCERRFSKEDFYIYILAHEYKHYSNSGTGLRSLLDTYVYLRRFGDELDWDYIKNETGKMGISGFESSNRSLAADLFDGKELTEEENTMLEYIFSSGTYGTEKNRIENLIRARGRLGYLVHRAFPPYSSMTMLYPVLKKIPLLLPFCWLIRLLLAAFQKPKKMLRQFAAAFRRRNA